MSFALRRVVTLLLVLKSLERGSRWCFRTSKPRRQVLLPFLLLFVFVDSWKKHEYSLGKKRGPNYLAKLSTLVKNLRKSRIQHCERSELHLHFKWTKVPQKRQNWSILASFQKWDFFWRFFNTVIRDSDTSHCICYCSKGSNIKVSLSRLSNLWKSESESSSQNLSEFSQTSFHFPSQHFDLDPHHF